MESTGEHIAADSGLFWWLVDFTKLSNEQLVFSIWVED
jgi:hypothetical protein